MSRTLTAVREMETVLVADGLLAKDLETIVSNNVTLGHSTQVPGVDIFTDGISFSSLVAINKIISRFIEDSFGSSVEQKLTKEQELETLLKYNSNLAREVEYSEVEEIVISQATTELLAFVRVLEHKIELSDSIESPLTSYLTFYSELIAGLVFTKTSTHTVKVEDNYEVEYVLVNLHEVLDQIILTDLFTCATKYQRTFKNIAGDVRFKSNAYLLMDWEMIMESSAAFTQIMSMEVFTSLKSTQQSLNFTHYVELSLLKNCFSPATYRGFVTLFYPVTNPTITVNLRNPIFGDKRTLELNSISRKLLLGQQDIFRAEDRPLFETLSFRFEVMSNKADYLAFMEATLGLEIGFIDMQGVIWNGTVSTEKLTIEQYDQANDKWGFDFSGSAVGIE